MPQSVSAVDSDYEVRRYRPSDREDIIALYETVYGGDGHTWLSWKYEDNPYVDRVPMTVATADGDVVAASPAVAFRLSLGGETKLALQPTDGMVHPNHRGEGLDARTTEHLQRSRVTDEPALLYRFTNESTLDGSLEDGWRVVEQAETAYRVQRPEAMLDDDASLAVRTKTSVLGRYWRTKNRLRDNRHSGSDRVTRYDRIPVSTLATLAREDQPRGVHAHRDARYLSWRFENPEWTYATYLTGSDEAYAGAVVGERHVDGQHLVALTDVYPPAADRRADAVERLVWAVVADHGDADVLVADGQILPDRVAKRAGFRQGFDRPLDDVLTSPTLLTRPATDTEPVAEDWKIAGVDIGDPENWHLSLAERDAW